MINADVLLDAWIEKLRSIPELVDEVEGDEKRIYAYRDGYPDKTNLALAIYQMPPGSVMGLWRGTALGTRGAGQAWKYSFSFMLRCRETTIDGGSSSGYPRLFELFINGVPAGSSIKLFYTPIHEDCDPMDFRECARRTLLVTPTETMDYFEILAGLTEIGDN